MHVRCTQTGRAASGISALLPACRSCLSNGVRTFPESRRFAQGFSTSFQSESSSTRSRGRSATTNASLPANTSLAACSTASNTTAFRSPCDLSLPLLHFLIIFAGHGIVQHRAKPLLQRAHHHELPVSHGQRLHLDHLASLEGGILILDDEFPFFVGTQREVGPAEGHALHGDKFPQESDGSHRPTLPPPRRRSKGGH